MAIGEINWRLTTIAKLSAGTRLVPARWLFRCECGEEIEARSANVRNGHVKSCGCLRREIGKLKTFTHGKTRTPEWTAWCGIKDRCLNSKNPAYPYYGGRGISIHPAWIHDFTAFLDHVGERPGVNFSLDRIDNDRGYVPGNLRWATRSQQSLNRRILSGRGKKIETPYGEMTVSEISERFGLSKSAIYERRAAGWDIERLISTPVRAC